MVNNLEISRYSEVDRHLYDSGSKKLNSLFLIRNLEHRQCKEYYKHI